MVKKITKKRVNMTKVRTGKNIKTITVKNADGTPDTVADVLVQNSIKYVPKVSVVIPVYNVGDYLRECLDSVCGQTLKQIEIICIDDGSTDNSLEILKEYANKDNRITVLSQKNLYAGIARNAGLVVARGEFLSFLDSDDFFDSNMLEDAYNTAKKDESDIVVFGYNVYNNQTKESVEIKVSGYAAQVSPFEPGMLGKNILTFTNPAPWNKLFKTTLFADENIRFLNTRVCNDFTCVCSLFCVADKISVIQKSFVNYRTDTKTNLSHDRSKHIDCWAVSANALVDNLKKLNLLDRYNDALPKFVRNSYFYELSNCSLQDMKKYVPIMKNNLNEYLYDKLLKPCKVSVVIPVYNVENYLAQCLDSVLNQTLTDIEVICVDDGSTDKSLKVLNDYANKDVRVKVIQQSQQGPSVARNKGILLAQGEFVAFMDSDDFYPDNNVLNDLYSAAKKQNVKICGGSLKYLKDGNIVTPTEPEYSFDSDKKIKYVDYQFDYGFTRFIYNRQFLTDNDICFPDLVMQEDPLFFVNAMSKAGDFYAMRRDVYIYRVSYKDKNFTYLKARDIAKSFYASLKICAENACSKLYYEICKRIVNNYFIVNVFKYLVDDNGKYDDSLVKLIESLDYRIIYQENSNFVLPNFYKNVSDLCKISVIIPVYNVEKYLEQCLDSVINQTYKNLEIICINDGSTDNSLTLLEEYAKKDKRIKIISKENEGLSATRNLGVREATGKYVFFLDSDDWLELTCFEDLFNAIESNKADLCVYGLTRFDETDNKYIVPDNYFNLSCYQNVLNKQICTYLDIKNSLFRRWESVLKLYKRDFLVQNNIVFTEKVLFEDIFFHVQSVLSAKSICFCDKKLYFYRVNRPSSIMNVSKSNVKLLDIFRAFEDIKHLLERKNIDTLNEEFVEFMFKQMNFHYSRCSTEELKNTFADKVKGFVETTNFVQEIIKNNSLYTKQYNYLIQNGKVSVIIPVYNVEKYLAQCLDSVINQTYKNLEIICVNDGSTDRSLAILEQYAKRDNRIKIVSQKNAGLNGARNTGLRNATGAYITFLDSDDWIDADWVEKAKEAAVVNNADMVKSGYLHYFEDRVEPDNINKIIADKAAKGQCLAVNENNIVVWATLYDRCFIEKNNLYFDPDIRKHEDILYTLKATFLANKIVPLADTYVNYRRTSSILSLFNKSVNDLFPIINDKAIDMLNELDCEKIDYVAAVKRLWWRANDAYEKLNQAEDLTQQELQEYLDKTYGVFKKVRWLYDVFDTETIKKLGIAKNNKNALLVEINDFHGECLPGYCKYLLDLGYNVDVLVNKNLEKESPMRVFNGNPLVNTKYIADKQIYDLLNSDAVNDYEVCLFNSHMIYTDVGFQSVFNFIKARHKKTKFICVEHRLEYLPELTCKANALVLKKFNNHKNTFEVNPHYFGEVQKHNKNRIVNFVVAGNIQKARKNFDLLIDSVKELVDSGINNFKITVIGKGKLDNLPENIKKFFDVKGRLSYPDLYNFVSNADFFMTLLDPKLAEHDRYLNLGTSGSFQLIYGLNIPCLIASKFAKVHHFSSKNAVCYNKNSEVVSAMKRCINMTDSEYDELKDGLKKTADNIYKSSLENLQKAISRKSKRFFGFGWLLLPYYLIANMFMKQIKKKETNFFVSLGENCFVRTVLTRHHLKKSKQMGELSCPFDLCVSSLPKINYIIRNLFNDYFQGLDFDNKKEMFVNSRLGLMYNHDTDCKTKEEIVARYQERIKNFLALRKRKKLAFVFSTVEVSADVNQINDLYRAVSYVFKNTKICFIVLDVSKEKIKNTQFLLKEINYKHIPHPYPNYWGEWYKSEFFNSQSGKAFEHNVCDFVKSVCSNKKAFCRYSLFRNKKYTLSARKKEIKELPLLNSDAFISLGDACQPAYWLQKAGLRKFAFPFDWMMQYGLDFVLDTLKSGQLKWFEKSLELAVGSEYRHVKDLSSGMVSLHHFPKEYSVQDYKPVFKAIFGRRNSRLKNVLSDAKNICFVMSRNDSVSEILRFMQSISNLYPNCKFCVVNVRHNLNDNKVYEYKLNKKCMMYEVCANNINENGADRKTNELFWIGNTKLWTGIVNKFKQNDFIFDTEDNVNQEELLAMISLQQKVSLTKFDSVLKSIKNDVLMKIDELDKKLIQQKQDFTKLVESDVCGLTNKIETGISDLSKLIDVKCKDLDDKIQVNTGGLKKTYQDLLNNQSQSLSEKIELNKHAVLKEIAGIDEQLYDLVKHVLVSTCSDNRLSENLSNTDNNNPVLEKSLRDLGSFYYLPNKGNLGDVLLAFSTYQYLDAHKFNYSVFDMTKIDQYTEPFNFVYGGGGIWYTPYRNDYQEILNVFKNPLLKKCVVLPSSFSECPDVIDLFDERFVVFCREEKSYNYCKSLNAKAKFLLANDMAVDANMSALGGGLFNADNLHKFLADKNNIVNLKNVLFRRYTYVYERLMDKVKTIGNKKVAYMLRADKEAINSNVVSDIDLSAFGGGYCTDKSYDYILTLMFTAVIKMFDVIVTDRLHVGICAAKLGKQVILLDNSYGKVSSVYNYSLKDFKNVSIVSQDDLDNAVQKVAKSEESAVLVDKSCCLPVTFLDFVKIYGSIENEYGIEKRFWGK